MDEGDAVRGDDGGDCMLIMTGCVPSLVVVVVVICAVYIHHCRYYR